jgi:hypothetical protein
MKCQCCGHEEDLEPEVAFKAGWDAPPHFSHVACPLCPGVCVVLGKPHTKAHALWEKTGRPLAFTVETCGTDDTMDNLPAIHETKRGMNRVALALNKPVPYPEVET